MKDHGYVVAASLEAVVAAVAGTRYPFFVYAIFLRVSTLPADLKTRPKLVDER